MLLVYAHPNKNGHCGYLLKQICKKLDTSSTSYTLIDLYEMKFNPVLSFTDYDDLKKLFLKDSVKKIQKQIALENDIIIIHPMWWFGPPAILKGFLDIVFSAGFAFRYIKKGPFSHYPQKLLKGKRAKVYITAGGPWFLYKLTELMLGASPVKHSLSFCGISTKTYYVGNARRLTSRNKHVIERLVKRSL